jgi:hypothetical protein
MAERRYQDNEISAIFTLAAGQSNSQKPFPSSPEGLTLAQLQSIGREVGIDALDVARAAASFSEPDGAAARESFGLPIEVLVSQSLPRLPTDHEWEELVGELRTTFRTTGRLAVHGNLRTWSNGNLHVCIEPAGTGYRLRMGTYKSDARLINGVGVALFGGGGLVLAAVAATNPHFLDALQLSFPLFVAGGGIFLFNGTRLRKWVELRRYQLEQVASKMFRIMRRAPDEHRD